MLCLQTKRSVLNMVVCVAMIAQATPVAISRGTTPDRNSQGAPVSISGSPDIVTASSVPANGLASPVTSTDYSVVPENALSSSPGSQPTTNPVVSPASAEKSSVEF